MMRLRLVSICASISSTIYAFNASNTPLWPIIGWNTVFILLHLYHIFKIMRDQRSQELNSLEKFLLERTLKGFTANELKTFLSFASKKKLVEEKKFITCGSTLNELYLVIGGTVRIEVDGIEITRCQAGAFVGEISFLTGDGATADVISVEPSELLVWDKDSIQKWLKQSARNELLFHKSLGLNLMQAVRKNNQAQSKISDPNAGPKKAVS